MLSPHAEIASYLDVAGLNDASELDAKFDGINQQWQKLCESSCLSEKTMHNQTSDVRMDFAIEKINGGDDLPCLLLTG
ncbi:hypothetical protein [Enterobacter chuandaensis]|uniref:hypothetical protein n=1 Tax=Enterobacter chuandaensis TaxID=2497875 RepID=UPI001AD7F08C|nr:hypothetical protein [Enterobacter chuandaensis]